MASTHEFDPYHRWLGIPPKDQPPHYYRLLALELFESDPEVIALAADQRMAHLKTFQSGAGSNLSQRLLNEIAAARVCLLNAERKAAYDAQLRAELSPRPPAMPAAPISPPPGVRTAVYAAPAYPTPFPGPFPTPFPGPITPQPGPRPAVLVSPVAAIESSAIDFRDDIGSSRRKHGRRSRSRGPGAYNIFVFVVGAVVGLAAILWYWANDWRFQVDKPEPASTPRHKNEKTPGKKTLSEHSGGRAKLPIQGTS